MWTGSNARRAAGRDAGSDIRSAAGSLVGHHSGCSFPTLTPLAAPRPPMGVPIAPAFPISPHLTPLRLRPRLINLTPPVPLPAIRCPMICHICVVEEFSGLWRDNNQRKIIKFAGYMKIIKYTLYVQNSHLRTAPR